MKKNTTRKKKTSQSLAEATGFSQLLTERIDMIFGILLIVISIYTVFALCSYFVTGAHDQSILENMRSGDFFNQRKSLVNVCGSMGALLSYWLMARGIGLAAFLLPVMLFLFGLRLTHAWKPNLLKWFFGLSIAAIWGSVFCSAAVTPLWDSLHFDCGGDHGAYVCNVLSNIVGEPGLWALLFLVAIIFLIFISSETVKIIKKTLNPIKYLMSSVKTTVTNIEPSETPASTVIPTSEEKPTVVDLTPMPAKDAKPKVEPKAPTEGKEPGLVVGLTKEEAAAQGKRLNAEVDLSKPINPLEPFTRYKFPTLDLLKKYDNDQRPQINYEEIKSNNARIVEVLHSFGVSIKEIKATVGPTVTLYEITPAEGVRISRIRNLQDDIALSLAALGIRIIAPIPGKGTIGIEVPNQKKQIVSMHSILNTQKFQQTKMELPIALGKTITNELFMLDLAKIPHLLVAGATGQGKSVGLNCILTSLLYKKHPNELKIVLVDPKQVEFSIYAPITDHFMATVNPDEEAIITDPQKVVKTLNSLCVLMDDRYSLLKKAGARNIKEYNEKFLNHRLNPEDGHEFMPYIVVVIDEFGDLIMTAGKEVELPIARIAQKARAVGMHMIIATQRPTTNIITGTIKANFPGRMAFKVAALIDSRTILDRAGAEQLIGRGDMLILDNGEPIRVQCAFVDTPEVERIAEYIADQPGPVEPMILPEPVNEDGSAVGAGGAGMGNLDPMFEEAAKAIISTQQGSTSMIQRRLAIGYNRAGRIMDQLEAAGVVGPAQGAKPRDVLIQDFNTLDGLILRLKGQEGF